MQRIAKFEKVSYEEFEKGFEDCFPKCELECKEVYEQIKVPKRATKGSAGYDFFAPVTFSLKPGETIKIPTGIRVWMEEHFVLKLYPRSGLGFKYRLQLNNTVGIIDSDYYYSDNEGHIFAKITNDLLWEQRRYHHKSDAYEHPHLWRGPSEQRVWSSVHHRYDW